MGSGQTRRISVGHGLAAFTAALFISCTSGSRTAIDGATVFDEEVVLVRGEKIDSAKREFLVDRDATFVAMVEEDDTGVIVTMSHAGANAVAPRSILVDSVMESEGIEVAVLDAPRGSKLTLSLESAPNFDRPGKIRLQLLRYEADRASDPRVASRLSALRSWSAATDANVTGDDFRKSALRDIDRALDHLESAEGDASLAAWGRMVRSRLNYRQLTDLNGSLVDAERAERGFAATGASRNAARARFQQAYALVEIAHDKTATDPGPEEAAARARKILISLSNEPAMSAMERGRVLNLQGVLAYHLYDLREARAKVLAAAQAYEAIGDYSGRLQALGNLGALAVEEGDYRGATRFFDKVIAELHRFESTQIRATLLYNAAVVDKYAGNIDRAIERFLQALEMTRIDKLKTNRARILLGLGSAYWARGDTAQAVAFANESLEVGREIEDAFILTGSLGLVGNLARESGDIPKALGLHREVVSRAAAPNMRVLALLDLARDYEAMSDYPRAIATCREALSISIGLPQSYLRFEVQLVLADLLFSQPHRTSQALREARVLTEESLAAAIARGDTTREIGARRLLAELHVPNNELREARDQFEKAIALIFKYRGTINNPELRAMTAAHEQETFRGYVNLLMRDVARVAPDRLRMAAAPEEQALRTLEWARAQNLDPRSFSQLEGASQEKLDELLVQMAGKRVRSESLLNDSSSSSRDIELLQFDIARLRAEVDRLRSEAQRNIHAVDALSGAPAWPSVPAGVTQISYAIETRNAFIWVRDASGLRVTKLAASPESIKRELGVLAKAVRARASAPLEASLKRLSVALLPAGTIAADTSTVEIVAEGQVAKIPFAALRDPAGPAELLSEKRSIVMIGSLFEPNVAPSLKAHKWGFVALANDARSSAEKPASRVFPPLPMTNVEARTIAAMFEKLDPPSPVSLLFGQDGNAVSLKSTWESGIGALHFATHGLADLRQPLASMLLLPSVDAAGNSAYLTAGQVQEWRGDADLVYLSACETAVGPARFADGPPGLQRAFLRAGARGVIATLWPVEDVYAGQFAADFYRRYTAGMPAARALSETQRGWMRSDINVRPSDQLARRMTAWAHAFYAQ